nr:DUF4275 family protein [Sporosarcina limicola]
MYQGLQYIIQYSKVNEIVAADFDDQQDIYIIDKDFSWTYVHTHESSCGPYFYKVVHPLKALSNEHYIIIYVRMNEQLSDIMQMSILHGINCIRTVYY